MQIEKGSFAATSNDNYYIKADGIRILVEMQRRTSGVRPVREGKPRMHPILRHHLPTPAEPVHERRPTR